MTALAYLDTSAATKLLADERETAALREALEAFEALASSELLITELTRAVRRKALGRRAVEQRGLRDALRQTLGRVDLVPLDRALLEAAADLPGAWLRTLDAIHVTSALALGDGIGSFVTYDERQGEAAAAHGLTVLSPSADVS